MFNTVAEDVFVEGLSFKSIAAGAIMLSAALAWNEVARTMVSSWCPNSSRLSTTLLYAIIVTIILIIIIWVVNRSVVIQHTIIEALSGPK